jgi:hypothetical protein
MPGAAEAACGLTPGIGWRAVRISIEPAKSKVWLEKKQVSENRNDRCEGATIPDPPKRETEL